MNRFFLKVLPVKRSSSPAKVLLIGWDAADWKMINPLMDAGLMPNLNRLVEGGVIGNLATLRPCLSPILWTSIATGKTADKHGITGFVEPVPGGSGLRLSPSTSRKTKALWNILSQNDLRSVVIGWYASHPAEPIQGTIVSNRFFEGLPVDPNQEWEVIPGSVHPETLGPVISGFRMHPAEFSLEDMTRMIPGIGQIDHGRDNRPQKLAELLARAASVHSVTTGALEAEPWDFAAVYYDALDVAGHMFMPYHPPQMSGVSDQDFHLYQHVMRELYLFHDEMLGRLLQLAGDDTTVMLVSDHGFHSDHLRPASMDGLDSEEALAAAWHRHYGVIAMKGPGILKDERIYGATLLDVAPTVLTLFNLPGGQDMDGRPLSQVFSSPKEDFRTIASWDQQPGADGMHPSGLQQSMMDSPEAIEQLIALGYLPSGTAESKESVAIAIAESNFNLAIVHSSHGRAKEAVRLLEELFQTSPDNTRYGLALAKAYANLKEHGKCRRVVESLEAGGLKSAEAELLMAASLFNEGDNGAALTRLLKAEETWPPSTALFNMTGQIHLAQSGWQLAADAFVKSLQLDEEDPHANNGLARAQLKLGDCEQAAEHALRAVALLFFFPQAHYHLGMAFKGMGDPNRAIRSLDLAVTQSPGFVDAHQELANLYEQTHNVPLWLNHQRMASGLPPLQ